MDKYIKRLRQYVEANPTLFDDDCDPPALDSLYWHYGKSHYWSNEKTSAANRAIRDYFGNPSPQEEDAIFTLIGTLCAEHERIAFLAELQLGAQLMLELSEAGKQRRCVQTEL